MFNSVFKKMTFVYLIVIIISFIILGIVAIEMLEDYYFDKRAHALTEEGQKLNNTIIDYLNRKVNYGTLKNELNSIEKFLNAKIWLIDKQGYIYGVSNETEGNWIGKQVSTDDLVKVLKGDVMVKRGEYDELFGGPVLTVGVPIFVNGIVVNGVIMHSPIYEIDETLNEIYKIILYSMVISLMIVLIPLYFTSQRISKPLREMNKITKIIASGEFEKRLNINTNDEIGQLAKSFNNMAGELEEIEEKRRGFIADVSHELRSPLTLIRGYIKALMDKETSDDKKNEYLNITYEETERLSELINNLLDLSKMESGNYPLNLTTFDLNELIRRSIIKFGNKLEGKDINVEVNFREDPIYVSGEKDSISRVISNIIDNAIKFMEREDSLTILTEIKNNKAYVYIKDTGCGIPKKDLQNIWKRFHKGDKSRSRQITGTGLGLSIVKEIIKNHNEEIWVKSEERRGTEFVFTLTLSTNTK